MTSRCITLILIAMLSAAAIASACGENAEDIASPPTSAAPAVQGAPTAVPQPATATAKSQISPPSQTTDTPALSVVSTSNIVGDWVRRVGGERVSIFSLLPPDADPHTFQPGARDVARVADADLILSVGLSLEGGWLDELIENAARDHESIVSLGELAEPIEFAGIFGEDDHDEEEEEGHDEDGDSDGEEEDDQEHGSLDPHFWFDPLRVQSAVNEIAARLSTLDPEGADYYTSNADSYIRELGELHSWVQERVEAIPEENRILVTSHDSFQYFATRYDFEVVGAIFPTTTEAEPTAQDLAALVETIEHEGARVVFGENVYSDRLAQRIAEETGAAVVGSLYTGSLGEPGGEAGTYVEMMRFNVNTIVAALK